MLTGKTAIVTGAGKGIGSEIALTLAGYGAWVIVNYKSSEEAAAATVEKIKNLGGEATLFGADVSVPEEAASLIDFAISEYGGVDILVNNAGITRDGIIGMMSKDGFDAVMDANLGGCFNCMKSVYKSMLRRRCGRIVNITSVVGITGNAGQANYSASKAGIIGLTKSAAKEMGGRGITVNAIAPGFIETDMTDKLPDDVKAAYMKQIALGRFGSPRDVAEAVAFLASDRAAYITGQVIRVDGGM